MDYMLYNNVYTLKLRETETQTESGGSKEKKEETGQNGWVSTDLFKLSEFLIKNKRICVSFEYVKKRE